MMKYKSENTRKPNADRKHRYYDSMWGVASRKHYFKNLKDTLDARQSKVASLEFRKKLLGAQQKLNYNMELDRLRGELSRKTVPARAQMERRQKDLEKMMGEISNY